MKIVKVEEERIIFDNGSILESYHEQECCENHYVDFTSINDQGFENEEFAEHLLKILEVNSYKNDDCPFDFDRWSSFFNIKDLKNNKYTLTIYNSNNGYYSTNVSLILTHKNGDVETFSIQ